jgi:hypothetical protein
MSACLQLLTVVGVCSCEANVQKHHTLVHWQVNLWQQQRGGSKVSKQHVAKRKPQWQAVLRQSPGKSSRGRGIMLRKHPAVLASKQCSSTDCCW